jgi:hypothetical protein
VDDIPEERKSVGYEPSALVARCAQSSMARFGSG